MLWQILLIYAALAGWAAVVLYSSRRWWVSGVGINLMVLSFGCALAFTLLAIGGSGSWRLVVWHGLVALLGLALTHRAVLVVVGIRRDRADRRRIGA